MIKVGLTGGIGTGKSLVSKIFGSFNVPVYNSDYETKALYRTDNYLRTELVNLFGKEVYADEGFINSKYLGNIVFSNKEKLHQLNSIVHPRVKIHFEKWLQDKNQYPYILKESAILFESNAFKYLDKIITVSAPDELRIKRVMERDLLSRNAIIERINNQWSQNKLIENSDFVIVNDGKEALLPQVNLLHRQLIGIF
jgi:dephospho-CoA kinase